MYNRLDRIRGWAVLLATVLGAVLAARQGGNINPQPGFPQDQPTNPTSPSKPVPDKQPDTLAAIGKIQFGNAGCSATVIGPRRSDGHWDVLTAAHCVRGMPTNGKLQLRDGRVVSVIVMATDPTSDCCWLQTTDATLELPFALMADKLPLPGERVWHAGFGVDKPGNTESGEVVVSSTSEGQTQFLMSVSSGDSGGGIALDSSGRVLSSVCCTEAKGRKANCWGCSVESIRKLRPKQFTTEFDWHPVDIPIKRE